MSRSLATINTSYLTKLTLPSIFLLSTLYTLPAQSAVLEEIIVTSQKREQSLQDVPISVNAISGQKMAEAGITEIEDLTAYVPNFTMNETGLGTNISIRGISSGINQGFEQSVGMYVDGIYHGRAQLARAPFLDLARVEVLRGPQSILFGKNSIAGAVSMMSAEPTRDFEGSITALYEPEHGEKDVRFVLSGPLSETVSARLAILKSEFDGYIENTTLGRDEPKEEEEVIRVSFQWDATDNFSALLKLENSSFDAKGRFMEITTPTELPGGTPYSAVLGLFGETLDTTQNFKRQSNGDLSENETESYSLNMEYAIGDSKLNFISGYAGYEYTELCDCDFVGATIFDVLSKEDFSQFSQEIRLTSPEGETIDYIAGAFYQTSDLDFTDSINIPANSILPIALSLGPLGATGLALADTQSNREFTQESDLWSVFAQATVNISEDLRLTLGGRYTSEDKSAERRQFHVNSAGVDVGFSDPILNLLYGLFKIEAYDPITGSRDESKFTPLVTMQWDASADAMLYATYTTGFKAGGFDTRSNAHPDPAVANGTRLGTPLTGSFEFEGEEASSFELGGKFGFADGAAELNVALYLTEYTDLQTSQFDGTLGFNVTNAGEATVSGIELDGRWQLSDEFMINGAVSYLNFEFDKFPNAQCFFGQTPNSASEPGLCDVKGQRKEFTPEYSASISGNYEKTIGNNLILRTSVDFIYSDDYLASPTLDPRLQQSAYVKVNARLAIGAEDNQWEVALIGKNLTDESVVTFGNTAPVSTTLTGGTGTAYYGFYDRPMSLAIQGLFRF